jgi:hypothetical protein
MVRQHKTHEFCGGCCLDALELVHHANAHGLEKEKATTESRVGNRPMTGGHGFGDGKFSVMDFAPISKSVCAWRCFTVSRVLCLSSHWHDSQSGLLMLHALPRGSSMSSSIGMAGAGVDCGLFL